jgi:hypothetical protein
MQRRNILLSRWRHTKIGELREAVLPRGPAPGAQCRYNGTRDTTPPTSTEEQCFLLGPLRGYITRPTELNSVTGVESSWDFGIWKPSRELQWDRRQPVKTWSREHGIWGIYGGVSTSHKHMDLHGLLPFTSYNTCYIHFIINLPSTPGSPK